MKKILLKLINFYQTKISPKTPPRCRFYPTCSQYAKTAVERFGAVKGGWLSIKRILKCNQCFKGGIDNVPKEFSVFNFKRR